MNILIIVAAAIIFAGAIALVIYDRLKLKRTFDSLEKMLNQAIEGNFTADSFDETRFSRLEATLEEYLSSSSISAQNVKNEKDKLKELISDISHQTKTPIANLVLYGELLEGTELTEEQKSNVKAIQTQTEKLRFLIDSLVKLSRLESGIIQLEKKKTEVFPILQNVVEQVRERAATKGLTLTLNETPATATIDSKWTQEAIFNIADNAVKYTDKGSITIRTTEFDMFVRVDISDTGKGIPEEDQTKIFGRFYRGSSTKSEEGVGIGLHLAREIITGQGGYIKVKSNPVQNADPDQTVTTFSIFLPK
ncbi:MAG: HAMP domain-containing histidine kinase [Treponema sp.]|nr:HAMP domain-containing histidine kinase [Treponema sp.]